MKKSKILFIDETGKHNLSHWSYNFILSGCLIFEDHLQEVRKIADSIIFKYWGSHKSYSRKYKINNIVFRASDINKCSGPFRILKDPKIKREFWQDIYYQLLSRPDVIYIITIFDKEKAKKLNSNLKDETVLNKSYYALIEAFIKYLIKSGYSGRIVAESTSEQDMALVNALSFFQRNSLSKFGDARLVNNSITSLSLVNKNDNNIGAQLADLIAWTGSNKYITENGFKKLKDLRPEENKLLGMFNKKTKRIRAKINSQFIVVNP